MCNTPQTGVLPHKHGERAWGPVPALGGTSLPAAAETRGHGVHHPDQAQNHGPRGSLHTGTAGPCHWDLCFSLELTDEANFIHKHAVASAGQFQYHMVTNIVYRIWKFILESKIYFHYVTCTSSGFISFWINECQHLNRIYDLKETLQLYLKFLKTQDYYHEHDYFLGCMCVFTEGLGSMKHCLYTHMCAHMENGLLKLVPLGLEWNLRCACLIYGLLHEI